MHERWAPALAAGRFNASTMAIDGPHPMPGWGTAARHWLLFADDGEGVHDLLEALNLVGPR